MSIFVCSKCGRIENTNCVNPKHNDAGFNGYPNLELMGMFGYRDDDSDNVSEPMMLCSECNTGTYHDEFPVTYPTELEKEYATYSKMNYIDKRDHPISIELLETIINSDRYDYFKSRIHELVLHSEYMGINPCVIEYDSGKDEIYDVGSNTRSNKLLNVNPYLVEYVNKVYDNIKEPVEQSELEKEYYLTRAKLKRLTRQRKKNLLSNIDVSDLDTDIETLTNRLKLIKG